MPDEDEETRKHREEMAALEAKTAARRAENDAALQRAFDALDAAETAIDKAEQEQAKKG